MKVICVGRNYVDHISELNNEKPDEPVLFLKPDTALLRNNAPFYHPDFSDEIHHEVEVLLKIGREGKFVEEKFAHKYYDEIGLGIDFTARDIQKRLKEKGLPWEKAKAFNGSAPISDFISKEELGDLGNLDFQLSIDGEIRQHGNTKNMLFSFDSIIAHASRFFTLKKGDVIFTGTPAGVNKIVSGNKLTGVLASTIMFEFEIK